MTSELDRVISPEILGDEFHALIEHLARTENIQHVLEIGSSAGAGSTSALVAGLERNPGRPSLYCMELSKPRFEVLSKALADKPFVRCFNVSSVPVEEFPSAEQVAYFYKSVHTALNKYTLQQILGWLKQDIEYILSSNAPQNGIELIRSELGIDTFDMVLIDGSEFTGAAELDHVIGAKWILLDDTNAYKCHEARQRLLADPDYELIADNRKLRNGYSVFRRTGGQGGARVHDEPPVHFFTIVLNGEPFIRYHLDMMLKLPFRWHWHVVEGVAALVHDTAWSVGGGGRIEASLHDRGRSNDGTSSYLDEITAAHPDKVTVHRKPLDEFWGGKREMVSAPLERIQERCLLWQIDADELWTLEQVMAVRSAFQREPDRTAAQFWCDYFVAPSVVLTTRYNYANNPRWEWRRVWNFEPGDYWDAHEPPSLMRNIGGRPTDLVDIHAFTNDETEALGAVFQHFAYVTLAQLAFKQAYYGYRIDLERWRDMHSSVVGGGPLFLRDFFPWVTDESMIDSVEQQNIRPLASIEGGQWRFSSASERQSQKVGRPSPRVVVDGAFFQHNQKSGIARVWRSLIEEWRDQRFAPNVLILDRAGTAPRLPGCRYRSIPAWDENCSADDAFFIERVCDEEGADIFISTYYTSAVRTRSVAVVHDLIPERLGKHLDDQNLREKALGLAHASHLICVSESTKRELLSVYPELVNKPITVIRNGLSSGFRPMPPEDVQEVRGKHRLLRPYFLIVGDRVGLGGYKNVEFAFRALRSWRRRREFDTVCVGGGKLEPKLKALSWGARTIQISADDRELSSLYSGAAALIYPSKAEGFGLPVLEALACGCPVVASRIAPIVEVGGDAPQYFEPDSIVEFVAAVEAAVEPDSLEQRKRAGIEVASKFTWSEAARAYIDVFTQVAQQPSAANGLGTLDVWNLLRSEQQAQQRKLKALGPRADRGGGRFSGAHRSALFRVRGWVLRVLPPSALPVARSVWRWLLGFGADRRDR